MTTNLLLNFIFIGLVLSYFCFIYSMNIIFAFIFVFFIVASILSLVILGLDILSIILTVLCVGAAAVVFWSFFVILQPTFKSLPNADLFFLTMIFLSFLFLIFFMK